jgi:hypothetical protein
MLSDDDSSDDDGASYNVDQLAQYLANHAIHRSRSENRQSLTGLDIGAVGPSWRPWL